MVWIREITRRCVDCNAVLKNRSKTTKRCRECNLIYKSKNKTGRKTGFCKKCNKRLSTKINKTGMCFPCSRGEIIPWNKGVTGLVPWNKGKSIFKDEEEYRIHANKKRRILRSTEDNIKKIPDRIRTLIRNSIRYKTKGLRRKNSKTETIIGCSINDFITHIESQFTPNMTWDNYGNGHGKWNIDHIIPISLHDLRDEDQIKHAFHYSNCRPMWAIDNIKKGNKLAAAVLTFVVTY
jgi:hypothetical protein